MTVLKLIYHYVLSWLGNFVYGFPSRDIFVLGVTGTKGKTTCLEVIDAVLTSAGKRVAVLSSLHIKIGDKDFFNPKETTMPGRFFIKKFLRRAVREGCDYALIEVTSQGVVQYRHRFIDWDAAIFLNLQPEHIEAHGTFQNYRAAKVRFFSDMATHSHKSHKYFFINREDDSQEHFVRVAEGAGEIILFHKESGGVGGWLATDFNLVHAAAARVFCRSQGIEENLIQNTLNSFKGIPGRMEEIQREPFRVVVDYAHTPDSLEAVYKELSSPPHKLICVLGSCGGGRDRWKRPKMGMIASTYCTRIILTDEDSYNERPTQIISEIKEGILHGMHGATKIVLDRREAIRAALSLAREGDTVVMTGKGSERWIHVKHGRKIPWDERRVIEDALQNRE